MKLLALVLLLSSFSSLILMEVVNSFNESCSDFFIQNENDIIIPTIFPGCQYKTICQRWENKYRFATVYDTVRRIPVYSAYTFLQAGKTVRRDEWKIEPQLENIEEYRNLTEMIVSPREAGQIFNQAVYSDYTGTGFTRGHVFPRMFAADQDQADSTFTLTNVAPQTQGSNQKWADQVEKAMLNEIKQDCNLDQNHRAYIVTGVVPGKNWISITGDGEQYEEGINIPSHFWSAYCCTNNKRQLVAGAYITKQESFNLRRPNIHHLNTELTKLYNKKIRFNVFPGIDCKKRKK
ncbi:endonuclease domain-containing 1 protein-like [Tachysurus fulvidraco]|uniref:endonuclease domain-containing 1 protein-like n=1 Tax=Tachysurus fulvidraco TaxID=1234273 RepID=UPI001FEE80B5|nr:endonuclease domain-containing 1 protein-like [Tachysurus fulvidraco]